MTVDQRLSAGGELFDYACSLSRAGIRMLHPDADDAKVEALLEKRLEIGRRLEAK